jgi:glycosyltransferase involved in cell wall biosynthesis
MRILYLSQYFPPEVGATQTRAYEMARGLVRAGHQVTMIAEVPNHPSGIIPPAYRGKLYERADWDGIEVIRVWVKASPAKTFRRRMAFYLSYMFMAILAGLVLLRGKYDAIYATSPPLFVGAAGLALSYLKRISFVLEVRDLWPESAVAMGELQNPRAVAWATRLEEVSYRRAKRIVVATDGIRRRLLERGFPAGKLAFIPNGANVQIFQPQPELGKQRRVELGLDGKFVVLYAGILGVAQGMEILVDAAHRLADHHDIHFLFIGEGPKKAETVALKDRLQLNNLTLLGERPQKEMASYFSAADVALVPLRKLDLFQGALPSKMFEAWACECPVVLSVSGEAQAVLAQARAGIYAEPEDSAGIAAAILDLKNTPKIRREFGRNGRGFVVENYSREKAAQQLEQLLSGLVKSERLAHV